MNTNQTIKGLGSVWLFIGILILIIMNIELSLYWAFGFPFFCVLLNKWSLPVVDDSIVEEILGESFSFKPSEQTDRQKYTIAHRTAAEDAPENTLAGIRQAKRDGAWGVEFDVRFTKDNVPILFHDDTLDRTTNGSGPVSDMSFSNIRDLDASVKHKNHLKFRGEKIPSLDEAVELCLELELKIFLEMKELHVKSDSTILELYKKYPELRKNCIVVSFLPTFLYRLRKQSPEIMTCLVWRPSYFALTAAPTIGEDDIRRFPDNRLKHIAATFADKLADWCFHKVLWHVCGVSAVFVHRTVLSTQYLKRWANTRMRVIAWVVDDPIEKKYMNSVLNVSVLTDSLANL